MNKDEAKRLKQSLEKDYMESFNARMRDEFLNGELFGSLLLGGSSCLTVGKIL